jgi:hypothetical protein
MLEAKRMQIELAALKHCFLLLGEGNLPLEKWSRRVQTRAELSKMQELRPRQGPSFLVQLPEAWLEAMSPRNQPQGDQHTIGSMTAGSARALPEAFCRKFLALPSSSARE